MMYDHDGTPVRTGRAAVNGTSLHYRTAGTGPAVVLLHGVPKTGYHWRHLLPKLTSQHTVVVPDLRGLGDSARPADGYDSATMSDDIAALMDHLGHGITYMLKSGRSHPDTATPDAIDEYVRCYSMPGGIRAILSVYRAMLVDAEQNRRAAREKLDIPVLALGGSAFLGGRSESQVRLMAHDVTGAVFDAGHDLAEEVPDDMAAAVLPFLAAHA
ncbi:alpha/beta fold hydrolase [Streptomyces sp. NPDC017941]|uniref:alpha/beta fold hydrolase n=1 Tax=Streptomyces sp. NPDC017941 TaxID=3365018 RepID=UPI0037A81769